MIFDQKYFTTGNYSDYLSRKTKYKNLAKEICFLKDIGIKSILDFGCGVGFLTSGLNQNGFNCVGYDKSKWAINYGKKLKIRLTYNKNVLKKQYDCLIVLDVLEHNTIKEINKILSIKTKFLLVRIPVKRGNSTNYYFSKSRKDKTHITCMNKNQWKKLFLNEGFIEIMKIKKENIWDSTGVYCALFQKK